MDKTELRILAKKYLNGTATSEEKELLSQWYNTINNDELTELVTVDEEETERDIKERIFSNIRNVIDQEKKAQIKVTKKPAVLRQMIVRISAVAAAVLILVTGVWYFNTTNKQAAKLAPEFVNITAKKVTKITLPDGSRVWLNANSVFKYPTNFTAKLRQVELVEGRAFFDVKHQVNHPFIVKTKSLNITVLGTSFDVRTYAREGTTKVSVITGKVGITRPGHVNEPAVFLLPKQQLVLNKVTKQLITVPTPEPVVNLWCKAPLVFDQENLDNVFKAIEKQYNTHIEVDDKSLLDERISITLSNQRLDTIMEILSFTKHFKYQIANDNTVIIK
ncbi:FecR family protein [Mucilaginibacter sp.]|uniref:FecR family protein n=1 Tax=Mucilaginibacter sp. TaxID=1882438 RepID=UPI003D10CA09